MTDITLTHGGDPFTNPDGSLNIHPGTAAECPACCNEELPAWNELFPDGRHIWYEGDDPEGFTAWARGATGFDPSEHWTQDPSGYQFYCPPQYLDVLYSGDNGR